MGMASFEGLGFHLYLSSVQHSMQDGFVCPLKRPLQQVYTDLWLEGFAACTLEQKVHKHGQFEVVLMS